MTYPVQPPEPPPLVYVLPAETSPQSISEAVSAETVPISEQLRDMAASEPIAEPISERSPVESLPSIEPFDVTPEVTSDFASSDFALDVVPDSIPTPEALTPETTDPIAEPESNPESLTPSPLQRPPSERPPSDLAIANPIADESTINLKAELEPSEPISDDASSESTPQLEPPLAETAPSTLHLPTPELPEPEAILPEIPPRQKVHLHADADAVTVEDESLEVAEPAVEIAHKAPIADTQSLTQSLTQPTEANPSIPELSAIAQIRSAQQRSVAEMQTPAAEAPFIPSEPQLDDSFRLLIYPSPPTPGVVIPVNPNQAIEVTADQQQFDERRRIFTAEGNVVFRHEGVLIDADWLQVNLNTRLAIGEGNVALTQPERVIRGDRFRYNLVQETGSIDGARGEASTTRAPGAPQTLPSDVSAGLGTRLLSDRLIANQPTEFLPSSGGVTTTVGAGRGSGTPGFAGSVSRFRFEADRLDFYPGGWQGSGVRITNDPFGPELEVRADTATFTRISPLRDEILLDSPRLVLDDAFTLPLLRRRYVIDRRERDPAFIQFGYDKRDRGGLFIFRDFEVLRTPTVRLTLTPQYYIQRGFDRRNLLTPAELGISAKLDATLSPTTTLLGQVSLTNLDPDTFDADGDPFDLRDSEGDLRGSLRIYQQLGLNTLTTEYSYRDRIFNGSLGFRTIHQSVGAVFSSPNIVLGRTGINFSYQGAVNWIEASTDRQELLPPVTERDNSRTDMLRIQGSAALSKGIFLWRGEPLPATPEEGLRFTPVPLVPYVLVSFGLRGTTALYSRSEAASSLSGTVGLYAQFGHSSKPFLDYTGLGIAYSENLTSGESPYFFDRVADRRILSLSLTQQIYGPLRFGIATFINLDRGEDFSTDYTIEYTRRSYGLILRYNPQRELGSFTLRISDFNWTGGTQPFAEVDGGVRRD
jgi:lipopolysaccharide export system protein LptA